MDHSLTTETIIYTKREIMPETLSRKSDEELIRNMFSLNQADSETESGTGAGAGAGAGVVESNPTARASTESVSPAPTEALSPAPTELTMVNVRSSSYISGWEISTNDSRLIYTSNGYKLNDSYSKFREKKPVRKSKKIKKKSNNIIDSWQKYSNKLFTPWQNKLAEKVHTGHHIILDIATSCGKTWGTLLTVSYETLMSDTSTAIFVSPNAEVLRENHEDICTNNYKIYTTNGRRMVDTQSKSFCTYDSNRSPNSQIICVTTENFVDFVTHEVNHEFINNLKYIVFDEVHLPEVSNSMYWAKFIPQRAQFLLLSATLGDPIKAQNILHDISPHHKISLIEYSVRPIALQRLLFKGCDMPTDGIKSKNLKASQRLSCQINPFDPTLRDLRSLAKFDNAQFTRDDIPLDREGQNDFSKKVINDNVMKHIKENIEQDLDEAEINPTSSNLFKLLSYIFTNSLQPALVFNTSSAETKRIASALVTFIQTIESNDSDYKKAIKEQDTQQKLTKKDRDEEVVGKKRVTGDRRVSSNRVNKKAKDKVKSDEWATEDNKSEDRESSLIYLNKWKFPTFMENYHQKSIPYWVQKCLDYGIGVYTRNFPKWLRYKIFDAYKAGEIQVLISDTALSIGINLPARTCILTGNIDETLYKQMGGRSGRRGLDNQGYVIPMFSKPQIKKCLLHKISPVDITVPEELSMIDLIRLQTPLFLDMFATTKYSLSKRQTFPETLKCEIMKNYLHSLDSSVKVKVKAQIKLIRSENWHVHRLTNAIKRLNFNETLIFIQLLITGNLDSVNLLEVISTLFCRDETNGDHVPIKDKKLLNLISKYASQFNIPIKPEVPIRDYFGVFCNTGEYNVSDLDNIEKIGTWIYVLKKQVIKLAPASDNFRRALLSLDEMYCASCTHN